MGLVLLLERRLRRLSGDIRCFYDARSVMIIEGQTVLDIHVQLVHEAVKGGSEGGGATKGWCWHGTLGEAAPSGPDATRRPDAMDVQARFQPADCKVAIHAPVQPHLHAKP